MADAIRTRCKFRVVGVEDTEYEVKKQNADGQYESYDPPMFNQNVRLAASYDTANPEDLSFAAATPSGEVKIFVSNPKVIGTFKPGANYYLDLIPC